MGEYWRYIWPAISAELSQLPVTASAGTFSGCEQVLRYNLSTPPDNVPAEDRAFSAVWAGMMANQLCSSLIVEQVFTENGRFCRPSRA